MAITAVTAPLVALPQRLVGWTGICLAAIAFAFVGSHLLSSMSYAQSSVGSPVLMALSHVALDDSQGIDTGYVDHVEWADNGGRASLRIFPTAAGRRASSEFADPDQAWAQVLKQAPRADSPGMREQFLCHWRFAEIGQPGKSSWNIEPWRPRVDDFTMIASRCNPGGNEESF